MKRNVSLFVLAALVALVVALNIGVVAEAQTSGHWEADPALQAEVERLRERGVVPSLDIWVWWEWYPDGGWWCWTSYYGWWDC